MEPTDHDTDLEYEYEYDDVPPDGTRILWGRVAVLGLALLLVFAVGRCSVDAETSAEADEDVEALRAQVEALQEENSDLQAHVDALEAGTDSGTEEEASDEEAEPDADAEVESDEEAEEEADEEADESEEADGARTHEVQANENLFTIAQEYYGDGAKFELIAEANDLSPDDSIHEGQTLEIPPDD